MARISKEFVFRLKMGKLPAYRIAQQAGIDPSTLSKLINGIILVKENDARITRVAAVLGLSADEAFDKSENGIDEEDPGLKVGKQKGSRRSNSQNTGTEND